MNKTILKSALISAAIAISGATLAAPVPWGYEGAEGPEFWGSLSPDYALCGTGKEQSPIDFISGTAIAANLSELKTDYDSNPLNVQNNGHTIQINVAPGGTISTPTGQYQLLQYHFHYKSEHTVDGAHAGLEAHFVHMNGAGQLSVLGVFIEEGKSNEALETILENAPDDVAVNTLSEEIEVEALLPDEDIEHFWHYDGSLTTPPCTEGVKWYVAQKNIVASAEQIEKMAELVHHNNYRPIQPVNDRAIKTVRDDD